MECSECGLVWLSRGRWPDDHERHYSNTYYAPDYSPPARRTALFAYRFSLLKEYLPPPANLLEVGAASGGFLDLLRDAGYRVSGVELSSRAAKTASAAYGLELFQGTLEQAAFPDAVFDYVVAYHALEHMPHPRATLAEAYRALRPGGRLLIEVPNIASIDGLLSRALLKSILDYPNHLYAFSPRTLLSLLAQTGFRLVTLERGASFICAGVLKRLLGKRRGAEEPAAGREPGGRELLAHARPKALWKRLLTRFFPGMKMTAIAEKPR